MFEKNLVIDSRPYGLFSIFLHTVDCLKWCEENQYLPYIRWASGRYNPNLYRENEKENFVSENKLINNCGTCLYADNIADNAWEYYFDPINKISKNDFDNKNYKVCDIFMHGQLDYDLSNKFLIRDLQTYDALKIWSLKDDELNTHRKEIHNFIIKNIKIKDDILQKTDLFINKKLSNCDLLVGVHVRGTDKKTEFPFKQLTIENYIQKTKEVLTFNKHNKYKIYIASDNNEAIISFASEFGKENIIAYPSVRMPNYYGNIPICLNNNINKRQHGEETLIEMLLLSKSSIIIGTDSNLTATACYFNPNAKLFYMNRINGV